MDKQSIYTRPIRAQCKNKNKTKIPDFWPHKETSFCGPKEAEL